MALPPADGAVLPSAGGIASLSLLKAPPAGAAAHTGVFVAATSFTGRIMLLRLVDLGACAPDAGAPPDGPAALALLPLAPDLLMPPDEPSPDRLAVVQRGVPVPVVARASIEGARDASTVRLLLTAGHTAALGTVVRMAADPGTGKASIAVAAPAATSDADAPQGATVVPVETFFNFPADAIPAPVVEPEGTAPPTLREQSLEWLRVARSVPTAMASLPAVPWAPVGGGAPGATWQGCPSVVGTRDGSVLLLDGHRVVASAKLAARFSDALAVKPDPADVNDDGTVAVAPVGTCAAALVDGDDLVLAVGCDDRSARVLRVGRAELLAAFAEGATPATLAEVGYVPLPGTPASMDASPGQAAFVVATGVMGVPTAGAVVVVGHNAAAVQTLGSDAYRDGASASASASASRGVLSRGSSAVARLGRLVAGVAASSVMLRAAELGDMLAAVKQAEELGPAGVAASAGALATARRRVAELTADPFCPGPGDPVTAAALHVYENLGIQSVPAIPADSVPVHARWEDRHSFGPAPALARMLARDARASTAAPSDGAGGSPSSSASASASASASVSATASASAASPGHASADAESKDDRESDAAEAYAPEWRDRVALFRDVNGETGRAVVVVARWLPHRGGWVEVTRYAAAEGSTIGLSAAEDGMAAYVPVRYTEGAERLWMDALHYVDLASSVDDCYEQVCDEFGLDKASPATRKIVASRLKYAMGEGGMRGGRTAARPVKVLEAAGALAAGDDPKHGDAVAAERVAAKASFLRRQNARVAVGLRDRLVGQHSRRSRYDSRRWRPPNPEFPGARVVPPDGTLVPDDFRMSELDDSAGPIAAWREMQAASALKPLPRHVDKLTSGKLAAKLAGSSVPPAAQAKAQAFADLMLERWNLPQEDIKDAEVDAAVAATGWAGAAAPLGCLLLRSALHFGVARTKMVMAPAGEDPPAPALVETLTRLAAGSGESLGTRAQAASALYEMLYHEETAPAVLRALNLVVPACAGAPEGLPPAKAAKVQPMLRRVLSGAGVALLRMAAKDPAALAAVPPCPALGASLLAWTAEALDGAAAAPAAGSEVAPELAEARLAVIGLASLGASNAWAGTEAVPSRERFVAAFSDAVGRVKDGDVARAVATATESWG